MPAILNTHCAKFIRWSSFEDEDPKLCLMERDSWVIGMGYACQRVAAECVRPSSRVM